MLLDKFLVCYRKINESVIADNDMDLRFTFSQKCCLCTGQFKTFSATQKHAERKHTGEGDRVLNVLFLENEENEASVPDIVGQFPQVPERYFGHLACQMGCRVHSMKQVPHKKPPFYCPSTRRVSYKVYSLTTDALHEQTLLKLNDTAWYSDLQEVEKRSGLSPQEELQATKNHSFWSTVRSEESSGDLLTKRLTVKASLEVGPGQGRTTREVEVIWWPDLYSTTRNGKLSIRFYIKKVTV